MTQPEIDIALFMQRLLVPDVYAKPFVEPPAEKRQLQVEEYWCLGATVRSYAESQSNGTAMLMGRLLNPDAATIDGGASTEACAHCGQPVSDLLRAVVNERRLHHATCWLKLISTGESQRASRRNPTVGTERDG